MYFPDTTNLLHAAKALQQFMDWLVNAGDDLLDAADLLGGRKWLAAALRIIHAAENNEDLLRFLPELRQLNRLLSLELADNLNSEEARRFLRVHPDNPRANNARICAEAVDKGIRALATVNRVNAQEAA